MLIQGGYCWSRVSIKTLRYVHKDGGKKSGYHLKKHEKTSNAYAVLKFKITAYALRSVLPEPKERYYVHSVFRKVSAYAVLSPKKPRTQYLSEKVFKKMTGSYFPRDHDVFSSIFSMKPRTSCHISPPNAMDQG